MAVRRLTRREWLKGSGSAVLALAWAALGGAGCAVRRSPEDLARRLVIGISDDIKTLDPAYQTRALDGSIIVQIHEPLTWFDRSNRLGPRLAVHWESPENGLSWDFHLREGVAFHDDTELDAQAVKFHFERIADPKTASNRFTHMKHVNSIEAVARHVVRFRMKRPFSVWPEVVRDPFGGIVSPQAVRRCADPREYGRSPVGTGPFRFVEHVPERRILLRRNPTYWDKTAVLAEEVEFRPVRETTTRVILLEQGQLDIAGVFWAHAEAVRRARRVRLEQVPWLAIRYIGFNNMKPPFSDVRVRRAANYAIDREAIVKYAFRGNADPARGPLPASLPAFNHDMETYGFDPDRARALMRDAGLAGGTDVVMWAMDTVTDKIIAETVMEQLRAVGIRVKVQQFDSAVYWDKFDAYQTSDGKWYPTREGVFDMFIDGWVGGESAYGYLDPLFRSTSSSNAAFYKNDEVDRLLEQVMAVTDAAARDEIYRQLQAVIMADAPWVFTYHSHIIQGVNPRVQGYRVHPAGDYILQNVSLGMIGRV
jgi:ABC-type transport system substrate-binding protein